MPADRRPNFSQTRTSTVNYISGGRGGPGGSGHKNGTGGAGGDGMGPNLSFDISVGHLTMQNYVDGFEADRQNVAGREPLHDSRPGPYIHQDIHHHGDRGPTGIDILHREVAVAAIYDSADIFPQPRCHPDTRTEMLEDLHKWALRKTPVTVLWLYGPAGAGKSTIMQTLASQLRDAGRLGGTFSFKRGHATRGNAKRLFATIAYQLALAVPWLRASISQAVEDDPSVVVRSIATQMQTLISDPCRAEASRDVVTILIDGLDECEGHDTQEEILRAIWNSSCIPLRFIVASRPEQYISDVFESPFYSGRYRPINVEQSFHDVRKYLQDEFNRIRLQHRTMVNISSPWPSLDILEDLVEKSSGYFIYPATIIKFIDDKNYRPTQRLTVVQGGNSAGSEPFDALDQLYMTVLSSSPRQAELILILCVVVNLQLDLRQAEQLFELEAGEARLILRGCHSLVHVPSEDYCRISPHHASFPDFLKNHRRSHNFCVENLDHRLAVARYILKQLAGSDWRRVYAGAVGRHLRNLISFLIASPPSAELCPLIARMDPDCIFRQPSYNIRSILSWLKEIPSAPEDLNSAPEDLINMWEDYVSMSSVGNNEIWSVKHILSPSSELCRVLVAAAFLGVNIWAVRYLLDITWTEFRIILRSVRPNTPSDALLQGSADHVTRALVPPELQQTAFRELALKCIHRVIKQHVDGAADGDPWFYLALVLEHCPPCEILYREFQCIPIHAMQSAISRWGIAFYRISRWLKSFGDPTLELVALWTRNRPPLNPPPLRRRRGFARERGQL
ncbi:hypothetical protein C8R45DRAFT_297800 [Mycena sanguinolenta]|nr:hypothetical protein C8R45DRAFT_297800 [Mycena sanguinolenta]